MGRVLAVDWGERRVGIALSDAGRTIASPHSVVKRGRSLDEDIRKISRLAEENDVELVLVGVPINMDGTTGAAAERVLAVVDRMRGLMDLPVECCDERLSTAEAEKILVGGDVSRRKRKGIVDGVAAALFLQTYLDGRAGGDR